MASGSMGYAQLAGLLTGKAMAAYTAVRIEDTTDYEKVKSALLHRYKVNEETHCQQFCQGKKKTEESYQAWVCRMADNFYWWIKDQKMCLLDVILWSRSCWGCQRRGGSG